MPAVAYSDGNYITQAGTARIAELLAESAALVFTRVTIGSGAVPNGVTPDQMTDLAQYQISGMIASVSNPLANQASVSVQIDHTTVTAPGFDATEIALWAQDSSGGDFLYSYASLAQHPEWIAPASGAISKANTFTLVVYVSSIPIVTAIIDPGAYATKADLLALRSRIIIRDTQPLPDEQVAGDVWIDTSGGVIDGGGMSTVITANMVIQPTAPDTTQLWGDSSNPNSPDSGFTWPD